MQLILDVVAIWGGFNTYTEFGGSLTAQLREMKSKVAGYCKLLAATRKHECELKEELASLWTSLEAATRELEARMVEKEKTLVEKQAQFTEIEGWLVQTEGLLHLVEEKAKVAEE